MKDWIIGVVAAVLLVIGGYRLYGLWVGPPIPQTPFDIICESCNGQYLSYESGPPPWECLECGEATAWESRKCLDCGHVFAYKPPKRPEGYSIDSPIDLEYEAALAKPIECPKDGSPNIGVVTTWEDLPK